MAGRKNFPKRVVARRQGALDRLKKVAKPNSTEQAIMAVLEKRIAESN